MKLSIPATLSLLMAATPNAGAIEFNKVEPAQSQIAFEYQQMGVVMDGTLGEFVGRLHFDPDSPEKARVAIEVALASIDTGSSDGNEEVANKAWLNIQSFPSARFESTAIRAVGTDTYEVEGTLSIKGRTKDVIFPATFTRHGDTGVFGGSLNIQRGDFSVGEGTWETSEIVANDILVKFRVAASAN